ncbi:MAG: FtsX-like permease family protein [bacterium]|nr:FtsX-like permease family protein [bacterium]
MKARAWIGLSLHETRGSAGRLVFFAACLSVGVAAVVAVAGLSSSLDSTIQSQARQLLAADLAVESRRPIPDEALAAIDAIPGSSRAEVRELPTVVSAPRSTEKEGEPGKSLLCELKAVTPGYPFYGELHTNPPLATDELLDASHVLVDPELLTRLDLAVGEPLRIGNASYTIAGTVNSEPDRLEVSFTLGPRILMAMEGLERSGLMGMGSRIGHRVLVHVGENATAESVNLAAEGIRDALPHPEYVRVETYIEAQPALRRGLERVGNFLGLVALLSLLIGGIGVAQAVRTWIAGRLDAIAILRALGVRPREVFALYVCQTLLLALFGSVIGAIAGTFVARALPSLLGDLLPVQVEVGWQMMAIARGVALGIGVAFIFGLRPLLDAVRVPPVRVLRRDAEPLPVSRGIAGLVWAVLIVGVAATASIQSASITRGAQFAAGLIVATTILSLGAWAVMRAVARTPRKSGTISFRHGLAALARPGTGTLGAVVALGLGVVTVLGMHLVQEHLSAQLNAELPDQAPTAFLIDIQPDQWQGVHTALVDAGAASIDSVEVVVARLRSVNDIPVAELLQNRKRGEDEGSRRWVLTREQRLTSLTTLPEDNVIVDGALWAHPDVAEVSIELEFAADLGVTVGDRMVFDVQGIPLELLVSSLRTVEWERFSINFFLVVEPGVLDEAPRHRIAAARIPKPAEGDLQDRLAATYPNITMLRIRDVLEKIVAILEQLGFGVRLLGALTVLAGTAILAGAVSAGAVRRGREVALYKTLGMTRAQVSSVFAVEYALIGFIAGSIGTAGGVVLAWTVTRFGFEMAWHWAPMTYLAALVVTIALSVIAGLAASTRALTIRPLSVLRQGE